MISGKAFFITEGKSPSQIGSFLHRKIGKERERGWPWTGRGGGVLN